MNTKNIYGNCTTLAALLCLLIIVSCSAKGGPTIPSDPERSAEVFSQLDVVFPWTGVSTYGTVDIATLGEKRQVIGGSPVAIEYCGEPRYWTAAVSIEHLAYGDRLRYAWLIDGGGVPVKRGLVFPLNPALQIDYPKVDAIYIPSLNPEES
jgi:hypothetical protein